MTTLIVVDRQRPFFADPTSVKVETRQHGERTYKVVSASGSWEPDGAIAWQSWHADRAEIRETS